MEIAAGSTVQVRAGNEPQSGDLLFARCADHPIVAGVAHFVLCAGSALIESRFAAVFWPLLLLCASKRGLIASIVDVDDGREERVG